MLDPVVVPFVPQIDVRTMSLEQMRAFGAQFATSAPKRSLQRVTNRTIDGPAGPLRLRIYYPDNVDPLGLVVFIHGGGWCMGDLETHDGASREICHFTDFAVAAMEYRLAPEHRFPAGLRDAEAATAWLLDNAKDLGCDPNRIVIMGESAGANLVAVITQRLKERRGARPCYQVLVFPLTDFTMPFESYIRNASVPGLTTDGVRWCAAHYLSEADKTNPEASPFLQADLAGAPPTFVMTAEVDPLCDDGEAYGRRLVEAGVRVTMKRYLGMPHGFLGLPIELPPVRAIFEELADVLRGEVSKRD